MGESVGFHDARVDTHTHTRCTCCALSVLGLVRGGISFHDSVTASLWHRVSLHDACGDPISGERRCCVGVRHTVTVMTDEKTS